MSRSNGEFCPACGGIGEVKINVSVSSSVCKHNC